MNSKTIGNIFKGDKVIWMIFFFLCMISIIEVYSASSSLTYKSENYMGPVIKHMGLLGLGILTMICMLKVKCKYFKIVTPFVLGFSFLLLIWANNRAFKFILVAVAPFVFLIGLENLSTAMLLCVTILCMMIVGRIPMKLIGILVGTVLIAISLMLGTIMIIGHDDQETVKPENTLTENVTKEEPSTAGKLFHRADTWKARIDKFLDSKPVAPEDVDLNKDAQVAHANIAIASSNIAGKGPGNSVERDFLSQAYSDFIYSIIIEEMGIEGAIAVAMLYIFLLFRVGRIANRCENNFPAFLAMGLAILLVIQALFNMMVAVGLAPVTGQPLPLISRGGTSTVINCVYLGIILSISRTAKKKDGSQNAHHEAKIAVA